MGSTTVQAAPPRNIAQETSDTLATQIALAPQQLAAYQQTAPGYAQTDINVLGRSLFGNDWSGNLSDINRRLTDEAALQSQTANSAQRAADLADVQKYGSTVQGIQRGANQELFGNLSALDAAATAPTTPGAAESAFSASALKSSPGFSPTGYQVGASETAFGNAANTTSPTLQMQSYTPGQVSNAVSTPDNPSAIESALQQQALDGLALGNGLSADEARQVRVQSRAAADARGRGFSNAALADEVLNTAQARQSRLDSRRAFALDANNALRAGQSADRSYGLAKDQFRSGIDQFNAGLGLDAARLNSGNTLAAAQFNAGRTDADRAALAQAAQFEATRRGELFGRELAGAQFDAGQTAAARAALSQAAQMEAARRGETFGRQLSATQARLATFTDPFMGVLGRSSSNAGSNQNLFGNAAGTAGAAASQTRSMFDPFNSYAADLYNTNYNGATAANIANANNRSGLLGGVLGGLGQLGGAALGAGGWGGLFGMCWVARAVYGPRDPRWLRFRAWMVSKAPLTLLARYIVRGPRAAERVRRDPAYRRELRRLLDGVLELNPQLA